MDLQSQSFYSVKVLSVGDSGIRLALRMMGMGHLLGIWKLLSPDTVMPFLDDETKKMMAGNGMVSIAS